MKKLSVLSFGIWLIGQSILAQGTVDNYNRAFSLQDKLQDKVFNSSVTPQWIGNSNRFWYVRNTAEEKTYLLTDAVKRSRTVLFDHIKLSESLS